jgi:plastocyanin
MATDEYAKLHMGLVQNLVGPTEETLPTVLDSAIQALADHVRHAHLERSPGQQLQDIMATDEYAKLHMGLVQNLAGPTEEALTTGLCAPGEVPDEAAPAPMPGMAPAPAPQAQAPAPAPQMPGMPAPQAPVPAPAPQAPAPAPAPRQAETVTVKMAGTAFAPAAVKVHKGDTVVWSNADTLDHTVTSSAGRILASSAINPGKTYKHTFNATGTFRYNCSIHPDMRGSVVVGD